MTILGAGLSPFGVSLAGFGSISPGSEPKDTLWFNQDNSQGSARYIDPVRQDYVVNTQGYIGGMQGTQQLVYLALLTVKGTASDPNVGQAFSNIKIISTNFQQKITAEVQSALANLITNKLIILNSIDIIQGPATRLNVKVNWTDTQSNLSFTNNI
jgi:hypothetical protein